MTIPNLITVLRIILAPIFIIYLLNDRFLPALLVFILAGLSDGADGFIARAFNQKSKLGSYLDPVADKLLLVSAFVVLSVKGLVPSWLTVIVISRDVQILLGVLILFFDRGYFAIKPSVLSKLTTCLQLGTVFAVLSKGYFQFFSQFSDYIFWGTGLLTISSGLHYMRSWLRMMNEESAGD
ncbi:MAG: CDP-diacylglycerol--glycerol-3-phosphate 3-phosphatidyltransferase [Desulfobacterales bacterium]|nr:CDP-diacylglycerol--glycerol-3-phosphate 3-phosphatidyltransferase [Desulfobacterales bacterium]